MKEENDDDEADDDRFFEQIAFQRVDRFLNKSRPIIPGDNFDSRRQSLLNLCELLLDPVDNGEGVLAIAHYDDATDRLSVAVPLSGTFAKIGPQADDAQVPDQHRCAVVGSY